MNDALATLFGMVYPVGSIYMSATLSTPEEVADALGGTWVAWGSGRVPVGVDTTQTEFNSVEKTGGSKNHTHNLDDDGYAKIIIKGNGSIRYRERTVDSWTDNYASTGGSGSSSSDSQGYGAVLGGKTASASGLQPYITCYMYKRTA